MNLFRLCITRAIIEFILGQVSGSKLAHGKVSEAHRKIWIVFLGSYDMLEVENKHYMIPCMQCKCFKFFMNLERKKKEVFTGPMLYFDFWLYNPATIGIF